jgi:hypothetical protein
MYIIDSFNHYSRQKDNFGEFRMYLFLKFIHMYIYTIYTLLIMQQLFILF